MKISKPEDFDIFENIDDILSKEKSADPVKTKWYSRLGKGISTSTAEKKETPEGLWIKCPQCNLISTSQELKENFHICTKCDFHHRIGSAEYFAILFDELPMYLFDNIKSIDKLNFVDLKSYQKRLDEIHTKTDLKDSMRVAVGNVNNEKIVIACMEFQFIGGSLGSVMGEKFSRSIDYCIQNKLPFFIICKSGGARMMESAFSLMQLAKTCGKLSQLSDAKIPYITYLTDPTFGGISASFGMLGDLNLAEPGALIGFAGPRVIKETIKKDLPEGFQKSEFLLEHGFLDKIIHRKHLKEQLTIILRLLKN